VCVCMYGFFPPKSGGGEGSGGGSNQKKKKKKKRQSSEFVLQINFKTVLMKANFSRLTMEKKCKEFRYPKKDSTPDFALDDEFFLRIPERVCKLFWQPVLGDLSGDSYQGNQESPTS